MNSCTHSVHRYALEILRTSFTYFYYPVETFSISKIYSELQFVKTKIQQLASHGPNSYLKAIYICEKNLLIQQINRPASHNLPC